MFLKTVLRLDSLGFAVLKSSLILSRLLRFLPGWTIAGVVTSGAVEAKTAESTTLASKLVSSQMIATEQQQS